MEIFWKLMKTVKNSTGTWIYSIFNTTNTGGDLCINNIFGQVCINT